MIEQAGQHTFDYLLHDGTMPIDVQWHHYGESRMPVAVQTWRSPEGATEGMHAHGDVDDPIEEIYLVVQGTARMTVDGVSHDLGPGDSILARPGVDHDLVNTTAGELVVMVVWGREAPARFSGFRMANLAAEARAGG
ncbi:cupin domain-containing protein [Actinomycetota bacterium]